MKKFRNVILLICLTLVLGGCASSAEANEAKTGNLQVYYIDVGQGDAALLEYNGHFMLIDAGDNDDEKTMVDFLNKKNVKVLDYVVGTHPHADHIGGMDAVINNFDVKEVYVPKIQSDTKTFEDVLNAIDKKGLSITTPVAGNKILFENIPIEILGPKKAYEDMNNNSIVLKLAYNDVSCLFTGDMEAEAEANILKQGVSADVLKVGHHGSDTSSTANFINAVNPKYAVISVGYDNSYGHPNESIVKRLNDKGCKVYRTDESGTVILSTNGKDIAFSSEKTVKTVNTESVAKPTVNTGENAATVPSVQTVEYIGNKNSKKFHLSSCNTLPSDKNKVIFNTVEEAVNEGYTPCQNCMEK